MSRNTLASALCGTLESLGTKKGEQKELATVVQEGSEESTVTSPQLTVERESE
ncbi:hypothetical protein C5167_035123 [Papaver somniferum]|uniref:Uncharacterized protein n=1 Tax=Papaver somniferum TaxID=3469 RepID=A0A4Y7KJ26_PAPSO|nr:hypothetical protein C5167_035123 [Papaver somniferum]